ncbi:unnamed protein product [Parascedosporium putredinis]|uniref:Uncharacterized protein n=1 Tax=Parascedosporium putredinis TaxID=1442378 RepID=A0A9P1M967_9PEZI|nr:unnamed protein product [Parascedosporium putredinis]CAI7995128.1 unnamed protein product [Parascedosporium putredinis]
MASNKDQKILLPLKLDAFVFNRPVFNAEDGGHSGCSPLNMEGPRDPGKDKPVFAKMAPIMQPNYTFLRLDTDYIQSDILDPIDLHDSWPADFNSRFTDLGIDEARVRRQGVYLHWTLPVCTHLEENGDKDKGEVDPSVPAFPSVPNRWLVIRHIADPKTIQPEVARPHVPEFDAWVVESDYLQDLEQLGPEVDLQVDVSPFISAEGGADVDLSKQAEVFIGRKTQLAQWKETKNDTKIRRIKQFSLLASSNQLFADYQPHCSNVFSIVDNFEMACCRGEDMFYGDPKKQTMTRQARLNDLKLRIKLDEDLDEDKRRQPNVLFEGWLQAIQSTHTLCHGAMYNVRWKSAAKPCHVPADISSKQINSVLPLSVGTTPMDALLAYARAHQDIDTKELGRLEELILGLETHLLARDDGVETQQQARDLLYNWNYVRADGGQAWNISGKTTKESGAARPDPGLLGDLRTLNREQQLMDAIHRTTTRLRWDLFSEWWRYVTDRNLTGDNKADEKQDRIVKARVNDLGNRIDALDLRAKACQTTISQLSKGEHMQPGAKPAFYQQRDPTLVVGGVSSGWPHDYLDTLQVRIDSQIVAAEDPDIPRWQGFTDTLLPKLPEKLRTTIKRLVSEFTSLSRVTQPQEPALTGVQQLPLFHDDLAGAKLKGAWRDRWNDTQAWFPLFLEWQVEYFHVPYDKWTLESRGSRTSTVSQLRYGIPASTDLAGDFSLEAKIKQLFASTPSDKLNEKDGKTFPDGPTRDELQRDLHKLAFLSAPLAGLTAHLTTVLQGSHIKPNLRHGTTGNVEPISQAEREQAGFDRAQLKRIGAETDSTPFGTEKKTSTTGHPLFKPATHGQFRFTRLNIIDKFGQAIHAIDPTPAEHPQKVWPCIGEWNAPQIWGGDPAQRAPNVIERELPSTAGGGSDPKEEKPKKEKPERCEFVQIPPQINQLSRLNSVFVKPNNSTAGGASLWKPADDWENPIWGWVLINYANLGIQLFQADGSFYREIRMAGPTGAQTGPEWLPFPPPTERLGDDIFLRAFWDVLVAAADHMLPAPDSYAGFANALSVGDLDPDWVLLAPRKPSGGNTGGKSEPEPTPDPNRYAFPVRLGDDERGFDGLVGYFPCRRDLGKEAKVKDLGLDLSTLSSHYAPAATASETPAPVTRPAHISLPAFWESPEGVARTADAYAEARNGHLAPVRELSLPAWTWQDAMARMKAFFHAGPLVVAADVPKAIISGRQLQPGTPVVVPKIDDAVKPVKLPAVAGGDWAWLQPYMEEDKAEKDPGSKADSPGGGGGGGDETSVVEKFMPLPVEVSDERARFESGPYTALEGGGEKNSGPCKDEH